MVSNRWIEERKANWSHLEAFTRRMESGQMKRMGGADLRQFGVLYRQVAADLSVVRSDPGARTLETSLNSLLGRAHNFMYSGERTTLAGLWAFFAEGYPRVFRATVRYTAAATILFLCGLLLGSLIAAARPSFIRQMLGPEMMATIERHEMWTDRILSVKPQASSAILTNNISVTFMTFAGGITAGLFTVYLLFFNGFQMGVIAIACAQNGLGLSLWSFVAAHGALELPSIMFAGGAGLRLAAGLLFPGVLTRRDSLARAGTESIRLLAGTIPLLIIAGILEAFLSPTAAPRALKFTVCAILLAALTFWLTEGGRDPQPTAADAVPASV